MAKFLKLVGTTTYTVRGLGLVRNGNIIKVDDEDAAENLLDKGTYVGDEENSVLKPYFVEATEAEWEEQQPVRKDARRMTRKEIEEEQAKASNGLRKLPAQAPVGKGLNQAESTRLGEEQDPLGDDISGADDEAYHEKSAGGEGLAKDTDLADDPSDADNEEQQAGADPETTIRRPRKPAASTTKATK